MRYLNLKPTTRHHVLAPSVSPSSKPPPTINLNNPSKRMTYQLTQENKLTPVGTNSYNLASHGKRQRRMFVSDGINSPDGGMAGGIPPIEPNRVTN